MKEEVKQYMLRKKKKKRKEEINLMADFDDMAFEEEEEDKVAEIDTHGKRYSWQTSAKCRWQWH